MSIDPRVMSEKALQDAIAEMAQTLGYMVMHQRPCRRKDGGWYTAGSYDSVGYPDLTIVGFGNVFFIEVKSDKGKPSAEQVMWIEAMQDTPNYAAVWYPLDWRSGFIEDILKEGALR